MVTSSSHMLKSGAELISFVIPCFKSRPVLAALCGDILELAAERRLAVEIILVLDSRDISNSGVLADPIFAPENVKIIELSRNFGQHNALAAGISKSVGQFIVTLDDDYQHDPEDAFSLVEQLKEDNGLDLIYATPRQSRQTLLRSTAGTALRAVLRLAGLRNADAIGPFRAFRGDFRRAFESLRGPTVSIDIVLSWVVGSVKSVVVDYRERTEGVSGYSAGKLFRLAMTYLTSHSVAPLRLSFFAGLAGLTLTAGSGVYTLVSFLAGQISEPGFTTVALLVSFTGSLQLFILGILGEYIGQQHRRGNSLPLHFVLRENGNLKPSGHET